MTPATMRDINGKSVALLGRRPPHFSTGVYMFIWHLGKKGRWRQPAVVLAAAYLIEMEKSEGDKEFSFFKTLDFRYSPDYIEKAKNLGKQISPARNHSADILNRYDTVIRLKKTSHLLPGLKKILSNSGELQEFTPQQEDDQFLKKFPLDPADFSLPELICSMLIIEFPQTVRGMHRDSISFIVHFLQLAKPQIAATAKDPDLRADLSVLD